ncbi:ABC transporter ATP-binding protein [Bifidobacterium tsurumiense]|uniref:ABC transporter ATP-binding protein n=1 Tax=Bifidobacterium tsurumiense TaxID=356829 RepID=UPI0012B235A1|nr:ABC transporter ATP-binding protein [Bifidobacterium tsurumiense]MSS12409.1 ABC transporter ATP-binding protein [Bifidobacterium tsurumiense]
MIEFSSVSKTYPSGQVAVRDFSLVIPSHSITTIVGSSGSGKTTLLRMVNRMVTPSSGQVLIDDEDIATVDPIQLRRRIGYVLQEGGLLPHRTIIDNVTTVLRLQKVGKREARERGMEMMKIVGLDTSLATRYPSELSGGQVQRAGVARALVTRPNIMLMDEPFGAVDPIVRRELQDELLRIHTELGTTIVFITHDIDEALRLGEQIVIMSQGGVVEQIGTPEEILTKPANEFVANFIGINEDRTSITTAQVGDKVIAYDSLGRPLGVLR